jgi:hypothetical protein
VTAITAGWGIGTHNGVHICGFNVTNTSAHAHGIAYSGSQGGHLHAPPQRAQTLDHGPSVALLD